MNDYKNKSKRSRQPFNQHAIFRRGTCRIYVIKKRYLKDLRYTYLWLRNLDQDYFSSALSLKKIKYVPRNQVSRYLKSLGNRTNMFSTAVANAKWHLLTSFWHACEKVSYCQGWRYKTLFISLCPNYADVPSITLKVL